MWRWLWGKEWRGLVTEVITCMKLIRMPGSLSSWPGCQIDVSLLFSVLVVVVCVWEGGRLL